MQLKTLDELITRAQTTAGLRGNRSLTPSDWADLINQGLAAMHAEVAKYGTGYYDETVLVPTVADDELLPLPADHMTTRLLQRLVGLGSPSSYEGATEVAEEDHLSRYPTDDYRSRPGVYWYRASSIVLRPIPTSIELVRLAYTRRPPILVNGTDQVDVVTGWDEYVCEYAAGYAHQDRAKRDKHMAAAERVMARLVAPWGKRRDRSPRYVANARRRPRRGRNYGW